MNAEWDAGVVALASRQAQGHDELAALRSLYEIGIRPAGPDNLAGVLQEILDTAIRLAGADMGTLQLLDEAEGVLRIAAHRGFAPPFVDFFARVGPGEGSACGESLALRQRVFVGDVAQSPVFASQPALGVLAAAGVQSVQSTPLVSREGRLVGMLATHYRRTVREDELELRYIDLLAGQAADIISQAQAEQALLRERDVLAALSRLYDLSIRPDSRDSLSEIAGEFLETVIRLTGADMGNIQLLDAGGALTIVASRGFGPDFLEFFASVHSARGASCYAACVNHQRTVVEDVAQSPIFVGTPSLEVMLAAGAQACQSTPLVSRSGQLVGMLNTHYRKPIRKSELDLPLIDILAGQAADIIAQVQARQALRASERRQRELAGTLAAERARLAAILENLPVGVWVADQTGRVIEKNKAADTIWAGDAPLSAGIEGYAEYAAWYPDSGKRLLPEDYPLAKALRSGKPVEPHELAIRRFDGSSGAIMVSAAPITDKHGQCQGIVGINVDIGERKRLEQELHRHKGNLEMLVAERTEELARSERHYRTLVENIPDVVSRYDKDLRYIYRSPRRNGFAADLEGREVIGKTWPELGIPASVCRSWQEKYREAFNTGRTVQFEIQYREKSGGLTDFLVRVVPEKNGAGQVESLLAISIDVTERKRMEAEMLRLDRLNTVGEMAAAIGHEVRNPLTTVRGYLQMMQRKDNFAAHRGQLATMIEEFDRANAIISDFLALAKNKAVEKRSGSLNDAIGALLPLLQAEALRSGHELAVELGEIPEFAMDGKEIRQLLLNLARNAFEAMPPGGRLTIGTSAGDGGAALTVRDTGGGIPEEVLARLGTPFLTTKEDGTGLGLAVCYRVAERHGARIAVETSPRGTMFTVTFPG